MLQKRTRCPLYLVTAEQWRCLKHPAVIYRVECTPLYRPSWRMCFRWELNAATKSGGRVAVFQWCRNLAKSCKQERTKFITSARLLIQLCRTFSHDTCTGVKQSTLCLHLKNPQQTLSGSLTDVLCQWLVPRARLLLVSSPDPTLSQGI